MREIIVSCFIWELNKFNKKRNRTQLNKSLLKTGTEKKKRTSRNTAL